MLFVPLHFNNYAAPNRESTKMSHKNVKNTKMNHGRAEIKLKKLLIGSRSYKISRLGDLQ